MNRRSLSFQELRQLGIGAYTPPPLPAELTEPPAKDHGRRERVLAVVMCGIAIFALGVIVGTSLPL